MIHKETQKTGNSVLLKITSLLLISLICGQSVLIMSSHIYGESSRYTSNTLSHSDRNSDFEPSEYTSLSIGEYFVYRYEFANVQYTNGTFVVGYANDLIQMTLRLEVVSNDSGVYGFTARYESQNPDVFPITLGFTFDLELSTGRYEITNGSRAGDAGTFRLFADPDWTGIIDLSSIDGVAPLAGIRNTYTDSVAIRIDGVLQLEFDLDTTGDDIFNSTHDSVYYFDLDTGLLFLIANTPMDFFMLGMANVTYGSGKIDLIQTNFDLGPPAAELPIPISSILIISFAGIFLVLFAISVKALKNTKRNKLSRPRKKKKKVVQKREL